MSLYQHRGFVALIKSLAARSSHCLASPNDSVFICEDPSGVKGRGYYAHKTITAGELIFVEKRLEADNVEGLAKLILSSRELSHFLHAPSSYPETSPPPGYDRFSWSRSYAQAITNGYISDQQQSREAWVFQAS